MANAAFDTLATARLLRESGFEERQAAAITTAIKDGVTGGVATKADLAELKADLAELKAEIKTELKWVKLIGGAILAVLVLPWLAELISATMPG